MLSMASFLSGQQAEGLKTEKTTNTSILERKLRSGPMTVLQKAILMILLNRKIISARF